MCSQCVIIYGTETWAMKAENLHMRSQERAEYKIMMVR